MRKHHELKAWQYSMALVKHVYRVTANFPKEERYVLASQMRRAAISVPSNIAEGAARNSNKEFVQFLIMARGSLSELETQAIVAKDLGYLNQETLEPLLNDIDRVFVLIGGLVKRVRGEE